MSHDSLSSWVDNLKIGLDSVTVHSISVGCLMLMGCGQPDVKRNTLFQLVPTSQSGIDFENRLVENEDFNIIEYLYHYNGGGVAVGDINNDGKVDLYFSSNQQSNKLFLNKGDFQFEDITLKSGTGASGNWKTGVTMADVNGDGFLDIYVCGVGSYKKFDTQNQLYMNNGDLTFTERAQEYGLDFRGLSTQASFFDYDNDGDLDMYLLNHSVHSVRSYGRASSRYETDGLSGDRLYRNNLEGGLKRFTDVTQASGIYSSQIGYGLGVATSDINMDGLTDIYVSNDFRENDYLYLNQGNGTFKESIANVLSHSSRFSMGNEVADFNNDGLPDIVTVDMMPNDEKVIKASVGEDSYEIYKYKLGYGYGYQVARNTLQLNLGNGHFSDIAWLSGVAATDWSWSPLLADFDNDGLKDLFVSNGIVRRPNDLDYLNFISSDSSQALSNVELFKMMPSGKVVNFIFANRGGLLFADSSRAWGLDQPSYSNGAAYADLDNDGDLDLVVNNIDEQAFIYRNTLSDTGRYFLKLVLKGPGFNSFGVGTKIFAFSKGNMIYQEISPTRGFQSSGDPRLNIGLGHSNLLDSLWIVWPGGKHQVLKGVKTNATVTIDAADASLTFDYKILIKESPLLETINLKDRPQFVHHENEFVAFNSQGLMPHMVSTEGPLISTGDVNKDGLDDYFVGGAKGQRGSMYLQKKDGSFLVTNQGVFVRDSLCEDTGSLLFDADGDHDLDLVVVSGGDEEWDSFAVVPRLYLNDGSGQFRKATGKMPEIYLNASCVKGNDFDRDGDMDLFIGGRVMPYHYGISPPSYILRNDGVGTFTDVSVLQLGQNQSMGMVTDAAWLDVNDDGLSDLVVVGEWMPVTILIQEKEGPFTNKTVEYGLAKTQGWWNTLSIADFDGDGDLDFVAGNLGLNSRLKASKTEPVELWVDDFDGNGSTEQILTYFNHGISFPFVSRDQLVKQIPQLRKKFLKYKIYTMAQIENVLSSEQRNHAVRKYAYRFQSSYFQNTKEKFVMKDLPIEAQIFPVRSFLSDDVNGDGNLDLLAVGNNYATQPDFGRYDAGFGLLLAGDGKGEFTAVKSSSSGFLVQGEGRDINVLRTFHNEKIYLVSRNNQSLSAYQLRKK